MGTKKPALLDKARAVFFAAMLDELSEHRKHSKKTEDDTGRTIIEFSDPENHPDFNVVDDCYRNKQTHKSAGAITILHENQAIWRMNYFGDYKNDEVFSFVKKILIKTYRLGEFFGGRGLLYEEDSKRGLKYFNSPIINGFERFEGHDEVVEPKNKIFPIVGSLEYFGKALI